MGVERRSRVICDVFVRSTVNPLGFGRSRVNELKSPDKPFEISKWAVQEAWEKVKANKGAPGVDGVTIEAFEADLQNNLFKVWNRMSSGSYFPPPVRAVEIPKPHGGGSRMLGVPTIADRVAQTVVAEELKSRVEAIFHEDSYGYRPGRSAWMRWVYAGNAAGKPTGCSTWTSKNSSTVFLGKSMLKAVRANRSAVGDVMCAGGYKPRCSCPTVSCSSATGAPRKGLRFRPCWLTCSCTMRLTYGWLAVPERPVRTLCR